MVISVGLLKTLTFAFVGQLIPASVFIPLQTEKYYDLCGSLGIRKRAPADMVAWFEHRSEHASSKTTTKQSKSLRAL